ncbi:hypothetical protein WAF17_12775 [Bernardetia sp. ABR2-2B]|uniref:hypothetical protein n=1 Tax=Bernardetia sp. ABR2-2B TaxID=3127472 RepID=UPI0030D4B53A
MKLTYSIKKIFLTGVSLCFLGASSSLIAQNTTNSFSTSTTDFSNSIIQNSSFTNFSLKDGKETDMDISPWEKRIGITGAFGEGATSMTLGFSHLYGLGSSRRFKVGYGLRLSSFFGSDREFTAAPPDLASEENPQSFFVENSQTNAINLGLYTDYSITENVLIGFNIDVVGLSFGGEKDGIVVEPLVGIAVPDTAKPTGFNLLLVGDNDLGTLNSEFWIGYRIASNVMVRGAFSYLFTEYTTDGQYEDDNDRFRYKAAQGALGVSYTF